MKNMKLVLVTVSTLFALSASAQKTSITDIPSDAEGETTISISKGKKGTTANNPLFEITEGTAEIAGEPEVMTKAARTSWKKACDEWKKETKDLNKENQVLVLNCNNPTCAKDSTSATVCTSTGAYKVKTKIN